ncbi:MAG TPA: hypothetical protein VMZ26_04480 [Pyrinomonadaceae bacterium]|nr:hypothetical protein [Pyrinomonadaceae bacterium]
MKLSSRILLGLATLSQFVGFVVFVAVFIYVISNAPADASLGYFQRFALIMNLCAGLFTAYCGAIFIIFMVHAARNPNLHSSGMRTTWLVSLAILGPWAMPFYWFHHIWRDGMPSRKTGPLGLN